jgi:hypothetical protein
MERQGYTPKVPVQICAFSLYFPPTLTASKPSIFKSSDPVFDDMLKVMPRENMRGLCVNLEWRPYGFNIGVKNAGDMHLKCKTVM